MPPERVKKLSFKVHPEYKIIIILEDGTEIAKLPLEMHKSAVKGKDVYYMYVDLTVLPEPSFRKDVADALADYFEPKGIDVFEYMNLTKFLAEGGVPKKKVLVLYPY